MVQCFIGGSRCCLVIVARLWKPCKNLHKKWCQLSTKVDFLASHLWAFGGGGLKQLSHRWLVKAFMSLLISLSSFHNLTLSFDFDFEIDFNFQSHPAVQTSQQESPQFNGDACFGSGNEYFCCKFHKIITWLTKKFWTPITKRWNTQKSKRV